MRLVELFQLDDAAYHIASNLIDDANKYGGKVTPPPVNLIYTFKKRHKYNTQYKQHGRYLYGTVKYRYYKAVAVA